MIYYRFPLTMDLYLMAICSITLTTGSILGRVMLHDMFDVDSTEWLTRLVSKLTIIKSIIDRMELLTADSGFQWIPYSIVLSQRSNSDEK